MARNCFRFLGFRSFDEVDRLTIREYNLMMEAHAYKQADESHLVHQLAWAINVAGGRKKNGAPVYTKFAQFYDHEKTLKTIKREIQKTKKKGPGDDRFAGVREVIRRQKKRKEE